MTLMNRQNEAHARKMISKLLGDLGVLAVPWFIAIFPALR
jgi:hypothetical protein